MAISVVRSQEKKRQGCTGGAAVCYGGCVVPGSRGHNNVVFKNGGVTLVEDYVQMMCEEQHRHESGTHLTQQSHSYTTVEQSSGQWREQM